MTFKFYAFKLSGIMIFIFLLQALIPGLTDLFVLNEKSWIQIWRFVTSIFLHGGLGHIAYNLFALLLFGSMLEKLIGHKKFMSIFLTTGILANLISVNFYNSSLGASGAIFGIIGALILIRPGLMVWAFGMPMPIFIAGILWGLGDLIGAVSFLGGNPLNNTGNIAHLSGMLFGLILGFLLKKERIKKRKNKISIDERSIRNWENHYLRN